MIPKKTSAEFVEEARALFGEKYDYSLIKYTGSHHKVRVVCREHGAFDQEARNLLKGRGCPHCSARKPINTERFIAESRKMYGDIYTYERSVCNSTRDKVCVTCPEHGYWYPNANNHIRGSAGCPVCAGNKKLSTFEFVSRAGAAHSGKYDYSLTSYGNSNTDKVTIICPEHGPFEQAPMAHLAGQGCPKCAGKGVITTESFIALSRQIHGDVFDYSLSEFKTTDDKITLICKKDGHRFEQNYGTHIYQKSGCPQCAGTMFKGTERFVREAREVHGDAYDYSLTHYNGKARDVEIVCPSHGVFRQTPTSHLHGSGCPECLSEKKRMSAAEFIVRALVVHSGKYSYEKTKYTVSVEKVTVTCPEHGDFEIIAGTHIYRGSGCPKCSSARMLTTEEFIERARLLHGDAYDYSKVEYRGYDVFITIVCPKHGDFIQTPDSHLQGKGCRLCANVGPSKPQKAIAEFLSAHTEVVLEQQFPNSRRRFDIYMPEKKIAIEYNGLYWHSSRTEAVSREKEKHDLAAEHGVRTITIFEDEWLYQPDTVKRTLLSAIGHLPRVFARNCELRGVTTDEAAPFYMENHVQHKPNHATHFALFHNDEMVACMSFGMWRSNRKNTNTRHWELSRYAATCSVVGGASRLLNAFLKLDAADTITSYSDVRMFSGNMYEKLGFTKVHQTPPDYCYVNTRVAGWRVHKAKFQKKHLVKRFPGCDIENKTEKEICEEHGYYQVYDCGKVRWDLTVNPH